MESKYYLLLLGSVVIASFSQILLKKSALKTYSSIWREYINPWVIIGYGMMVLSTLLTVFAYRGVDYKNGPVIDSVGFLLVMIWSRIFFGEKITKRKVIGNILILAGILVLHSREKIQTVENDTEKTEKNHEKTIRTNH